MSSCHGPLVSFELMPPRRPDAAPKFWRTVDDLLSVHPDFVSVTYGAGGKDHSTSLATISRLVTQSPVSPIAHLTCVGTPRRHLADTVRSYLDAGVRTFLALRGDPPADQPNWRPGVDDVGSAIELISVIRQVEAQQCGASASARLRQAVTPLTICVAAFPSGNPAAGTTPEQEVTRLREKQDAGADFAITQLFWDPHVYADFCMAAQQAGVTIPIIPGILPASDPARIRRTTELTGIEAPSHVLDYLESAADDDELRRRGIDIGVGLIGGVIDAGAPGVHLYSFNRADPVLDLVAGAGLRPNSTFFNPCQ